MANNDNPQQSRVTVLTNLSLDGVMQGPAQPDEDRRGGFEHGGWAAPYAAMASVGGNMAGGGGLLFGRWTYQNFYSVWPKRTNNPYTEVLNNAQKYVASTTLQEPLPWVNSTLLKGNAAEAVARLKQQPGKNLLIMGSGVLIQSLMRRNLIDEYVLLIHPLILGSGRRLFPDGGAFAALKLVDSKTTDKGVVIATYQPA
jgi:dihydrofolate reductase